MNDQISVSGLVLHGHHGVLPEETQLGQRFYVDIHCALDLSESGQSDDYSRTVCYGRLCEIADEVSKAGPYKLIEALGERIAAQILHEFPQVQQTKIQIRKPSAPIAAVFDHAAIEIVRQRHRKFAVSLGSNIGAKSTNLGLALTLLGVNDAVSIEKTSRYYRTKPWGNEEQDWFMNACAVGTTSLSANQFLYLCKDTELKIGRAPGERWGPRVIDIDILTLGDLQIAQPEIVLPHPEMLDRAFVLKPLSEIAPDLEINGVSVCDALARLEQTHQAEDLVVVDE